MGFNGLHRIWFLGTIVVPLAVCACSPSAEQPVAPTPEPGQGGSAGQNGRGTGGTLGAGGSGGTGGISIAVDSGTSGGGSSGCGRKNVTALFVIDRSGSMKCNLPPTTSSQDCERTPERADPAQPSKWEVVTDVLSESFEQLVPKTTGLTVRAGLSFFSIDDECGARSQPSIPLGDMTATQVDALRQSLSITPAGGTPIVAAAILAYKHIYQPSFTGEGHVILLTDGADSCKAAYDNTVGPGDQRARSRIWRQIISVWSSTRD